MLLWKKWENDIIFTLGIQEPILANVSNTVAETTCSSANGTRMEQQRYSDAYCKKSQWWCCWFSWRTCVQLVWFQPLQHFFNTAVTKIEQYP